MKHFTLSVFVTITLAVLMFMGSILTTGQPAMALDMIAVKDDGNNRALPFLSADTVIRRYPECPSTHISTGFGYKISPKSTSGTEEQNIMLTTARKTSPQKWELSFKSISPSTTEFNISGIAYCIK